MTNDMNTENENLKKLLEEQKREIEYQRLLNENQRFQILNLEREKEFREAKDKVLNLYDKVIKLEEEKKLQEKNVLDNIVKKFKNYKKLKNKTRKVRKVVSKCKNLVINPKHKEFKKCVKVNKRDLSKTEKHIDKKIVFEKEN